MSGNEPSPPVRAIDENAEVKPKKTLTSRVGSLFASRVSHVNAFSIELQEDGVTRGLKQYGPGDTIKGTVTLDVARPLGITHLIVSLSGFVEVFKNYKQRTDKPTINGRGPRRRGRRWTSEYFGDGFASLFEDDVVLCGDGRLDPNLYQFQFAIEFPRHLRLPSSIKFERGQIVYNVTATLTRPHPVSPTQTVIRSVEFKENIDIASLPPPRPREATLKPVSARGSSKASLRHLTTRESSAAPTIRSSSVQRNSVSSGEAQGSTATGSRPSSGSIPPESDRASPQSVSTSSKSFNTNDSAVLAGPYIKAELSRSGCLPGQTVHMWINIENHHRVLRSVHGIIVTLHREARTDFQPALPLTATEGQQGKYEDYYPRSRSGIGGMSMDNAGSDKKFVQDLTQTVAPLMINPATMSTAVKVAIRVPDDAFQTIKDVPGNMISFRYFVEVIIDIQGKLIAPNKGLAQAMAMNNPRPAGPENVRGQEPDSQMTLWAPNCFDTTSIRQHKHAVKLRCELIVGNVDTAKPAPLSRRVTDSQQTVGGTDVTEPIASSAPARGNTLYPSATSPVGHLAVNKSMAGGSPSDEQYEGYWGPHDYTYDDDYYYNYGQWNEQGDYSHAEDRYGYGYNYPPTYGYQHQYPPPRGDAPEALRSSVPLPSTAFEEGLSEKERMARHEAALLPSQPDQPDEPSASSSHAPSAPQLPMSDATAPYLPESRSARGLSDDQPSTSSTPTVPQPPNEAQRAEEEESGSASQHPESAIRPEEQVLITDENGSEALPRYEQR